MSEAKKAPEKRAADVHAAAAALNDAIAAAVAAGLRVDIDLREAPGGVAVAVFEVLWPVRRDAAR